MNKTKTVTKIVAFAGVVLVVCLFVFKGEEEQGSEKEVVYTAVRGPLSVTISESGSIANREELRIRSEVYGRKTILFLIEEGAEVKTGDLLVELDSSVLVDEFDQDKIRVQNAEAAFIQEREQMEITKNQAASDIEKAKQSLKFSKMDLDNYLTGEYPQQLQEAKNSITLAEEELKRSEDKLEWSKKLGDEGFVTRSELEGDRLEVKRRQLNLEVAKSKLNLLEQFTFIRQKEQLESNVYQAEQALIRSEKNAKADLIKAEANLRAKESEYVRQNRKMIENQNQIEKCKIYAPRDGMVIYATSVQRRRLGNDEPLEVGQEVRERQDLIYLPTTSGMKANIKIHETDLRMVSVGMPVVVTVDALNGLEVAGRVAKIAPLPDQGSLWMNPDLKVYETEIYLDTNAPGLRTGMNCRAEVLVKHYEDVVYVPIQSVLEVDKKPTVFIQRKGEPELREVTCGLSSNRVVAILEGVSVGEEILLNPPLSYGELPPSRIMPSDMPLINQGIVEVAQSINVSSSKGDHNSESAKKKKKPKSKDALEE